MSSSSKCRIAAVSGCLMGLSCRFDGRSKADGRLMKSLEGVCIVPFCPEQSGGLPTPRPPAEFVGGCGPDVLAGSARVVNVEGTDVTEAYLHGAREMLKTCQRLGVCRAYLKEKSPACGVTSVTVEGELVGGMGVAAAMLKEAGIEIVGVP